MERISKGFAGRTVRAVLFIILIIVFCTAISSAGIYVASRFGLTQSREQVPLTALSLGDEGKVELPGRGKMGWRLRNSRDIYTLTLDNAVIESAGAGNAADGNTVEEDAAEGSLSAKNPGTSRPAIDITGDLIIELKEGSGSWLVRRRGHTHTIRHSGYPGKGKPGYRSRNSRNSGRWKWSRPAGPASGGRTAGCKGNVCGDILSGGGIGREFRKDFGCAPIRNRSVFMQTQSGRI